MRETVEPMTRTQLRDIALILMIAVAPSIFMACDIVLRNPRYLQDYTLASNPDAIHYVVLGRNFWARGVYSREEQPPFTPDILRTPVYPLVAGGLDLALGGV